MKYLVRSVKFLVALLVLYVATVWLMSTVGASMLSARDTIFVMFQTTRGQLLVAAIIIWVAIYPKVGYIKRESSADFDGDKEQILTVFVVTGYELMEQNEKEMRFRASNFFRRLRLLFEDEVVVRRSESGGVEIEGVRRTVAYATMRLNSYLAHKRNE
jgi:hypothetical protein